MEKQDLNEALRDIFLIEPFVDYEDPTNEQGHEMTFALAEMYANKGFRMFLENEYRRAIKKAALSIDETHKIHLGRIITLKEILVKSQDCYKRMNTLSEQKRLLSVRKAFESEPTVKL